MTLTQSPCVTARLELGVAEVTHLIQSRLHRIINKRRVLRGVSQPSMNKESSEDTGKGSVSKSWQTAAFACAEGEEKVNFSRHPPLSSIGLCCCYWKTGRSLVLSNSYPHPGPRWNSPPDHCHHPESLKAPCFALCFLQLPIALPDLPGQPLLSNPLSHCWNLCLLRQWRRHEGALTPWTITAPATLGPVREQKLSVH